MDGPDADTAPRRAVTAAPVAADRDPAPAHGEPPATAERPDRDPGPAEVRGWAGENLWSVQWW